MNFAECERLVASARDRQSKPVANNTRVERRDEDTYAVRLHATDVVIYHRDGRIELNSGGWRTNTTRDRINGFSPARLYTENGVWWLDLEPDSPRPDVTPERVAKPFEAPDPGELPDHACERQVAETYVWCSTCYWHEHAQRQFERYRENIERFGSFETWQSEYKLERKRYLAERRTLLAWIKRNRTPFEDGIVIDANGHALTRDPQADEQLRDIEQRKRRISAFVKLAVEQLREGIPMPSGGDCWYCALSTADAGPLGDAVGDTDHLENHIEEGYVVPSMLVNAMRERGYPDAGIYMMLEMDPDENRMGGRGRERFETVARALKAYLTSRLIPEASGSSPTGAARRETRLQATR